MGVMYLDFKECLLTIISNQVLDHDLYKSLLTAIWLHRYISSYYENSVLLKDFVN